MQRRFQDIAYLLTELTKANPGLGGSGDPAYWTRRWTQVALELCSLDLRRVIQCQDDKAVLDLHAALFSYILHAGLDGFMLVSEHVAFLAKAMSPYAFSVLGVESRIVSANRFINRMKNEPGAGNTCWSDYPAIRMESVDDTSDSGLLTTPIAAKLRKVSIGARQLFFGSLKDGPGQGHWAARPYGINEEVAAEELVSLGIGELHSDPALVLTTYRNEELLTALAGHPTKRGWKKSYVIKYMMENAPQAVAELTRDRGVLAVTPTAKDDGAMLAKRVENSKMLLSLALGFMEPPDQPNI